MAVSDLPEEELTGYFPELHPYFNKCKFRDCKHLEDSNGCGFSELNLEDDHDIIIYNRLISFIKMRDEIDTIPSWQR